MSSHPSQLSHLVKLLRKRGARREDAEDLVQEAVLRLCAFMQAGGEVRNANAFVSRVAFNLAVDRHRSARRDRYASESIEKLELIDMAPSPCEVLEAENRLTAMMNELELVSSRAREVFFMHRLQGFSHAEIAAKLHISKSAVEKHVATCITVLALGRQRHERRDGDEAA